MDDQSYDQWAEILDGIRKSRTETIDEKLKSDAARLGLKDFYDLTLKSLEEVTKKWWNVEKTSWQNHPPEDLDAALEQVREELYSVVDFEIDAIDEDLNHIQPNTHWGGDEVEKERKRLTALGDELKKSYKLKVNSLAASNRKVPGGGGSSQKKRAPVRTSSRPQGSGLGVFTMFIFGLLLGGGVGVNFWHQAKKQKLNHQTEIEQIRSVKRALEDTLAVLQDTFTQMAEGKIRNIPSIEADIKPIRTRFIREREQLEISFLKKRENIMKKVPPGDRLDRSLLRLTEEKASQLKILKAREANKLGPLVTELKTLREMMGQ